MTVNIIGYAGSYSAARQLAKSKGCNRASIQSAGQGWQNGFTYHQWVVVEFHSPPGKPGNEVDTPKTLA